MIAFPVIAVKNPLIFIMQIEQEYIHTQTKKIKHYVKSLQTELIFRRELEPANISVASHLFETLDDPVATIDDLFVSSKR